MEEYVVIIEVLIVLVVVGIQMTVFVNILRKIMQYKSTFPSGHAYDNFVISNEEGDVKSTSNNGKTGGSDPNNSESVIEMISENKKSSVLKTTIANINRYLKKNSSFVADFNLMKDILERNLDKLENDIRIMLPIPIYLGLMGTMAGIIIGLFSMPPVGSDAFMEGEGIDTLLGGVKIAMIASFMGILLTTIATGWFFKSAKLTIEQNKNDFYSFLQTELLPSISQGVNSEIINLNRSFATFSKSFAEEVARLEEIINKNFEIYKTQEKVFDTLKEIEPLRLTQANMRLFDRLDENMKEFDKFQKYLQNVNQFVQNSEVLNNGLLELLSKTDNIKTVAEGVEGTLNKGNELMDFVTTHMSELKNHRESTREIVINSQSSIDAIFKHFKEFIEAKAEEVKKLAVSEEDTLRNQTTAVSELFKGFADTTNETFTKQTDILNQQFDSQLKITNENFNQIRQEILDSSNFVKLNDIIGDLTEKISNLNGLTEHKNVVKLLTALDDLKNAMKSYRKRSVRQSSGQQSRKAPQHKPRIRLPKIRLFSRKS